MAMFEQHRASQFSRYNRAREVLLENPNILVSLEKHFSDTIYDLLGEYLLEIEQDYNEASYLFPFWQNYPPSDRGRQPIGDQYPWIEVGEHAIGAKLPRMLASRYQIRDTGFPTGADERFVLEHESIREITKGLTSAAWLFVDIKSAGPRDDADHTVMSHNQISGDGKWTDLAVGVSNSILYARGTRSNHPFHCSLPPLSVLSDTTIVPTVTLAIKPVYAMETARGNARNVGQPLSRIDLATIPNGLLLVENPGFLKKFPGLLFPGKDDKDKNPLKVRARVSFEILRQLGAWRVRTLSPTKKKIKQD